MSNRKTLEYLASRPWAITPEAWEVGRRIVLRETEPTPVAVEQRPGRKMDGAEGVTIRDGVATIRVVGPIFRYADWFVELCGGATVETLAKDLKAALDNGAVRGIVLDLDSPGGEATGIAELAAQIRAGTGVKPIVAYVGGTAASAGYWLASAASEIVVAPTAILGSIGVVMGYPRKRDDPKSLEFVSSASPMKRPDVDSEAGRAEVQRTVDALADVFVATVAEYRGVPPETVLSDFGRGGVLVGSVAVSAGLADRVGSYESVLAELASGASPSPRSASPPSSRPDPQPKGVLMSWFTKFFKAGVAAVDDDESVDVPALVRIAQVGGARPIADLLEVGEPLKAAVVDVTASPEYQALKAKLDAATAMASASAESAAKAWAADHVKAGRLVPAAASEAESLYLTLSADDAGDGGSRLAALAGLVDKIPPRTLTAETVSPDGRSPAELKILPSTTEGRDPKAAPTPDRVRALLAMTEAGAAALES